MATRLHPMDWRSSARNRAIGHVIRLDPKSLCMLVVDAGKDMIDILTLADFPGVEKETVVATAT